MQPLAAAATSCLTLALVGAAYTSALAQSGAPAAEAPAAEAPAAAPAEGAATETAASTEAAAPASGDDGGATSEVVNTIEGEVSLVSDERVPPDQRGPNMEGGNGLNRTLSADPGPQGTFRFRLSGFLSESEDFPAPGSSNSFSGASLALGYTPIEFLEVFFNARNTSNVNEGTRPDLLQTQGDMSLGLKGGYFILPEVAVGLAASAHLYSGLGEGSFSLDTTSFWVRLLTTVDLKRSQNIPVRFTLNVGYYNENSENLYGDGDNLDVIQEWGLQTYRYDRLTIGAGLEVPFNEYVSPFVEYRLDGPLKVKLKDFAANSSFEYDFSAVPHTFTPGLRGFPLPELMLEAAAEIAITTETTFSGVPATPPWMITFGIAYTLDPRPVVMSKEIVKEVAPIAPPPPPVAPAPKEGRIAGKVLDAKTGKPIKDARITYPGRTVSAQLADASGRFGSYPFEPGKVKVQVMADGYLAMSGEADVTADKDTPLELKLKLDPEQQKTTFTIEVANEKGKTLPKATYTVGTTKEPALKTGQMGPTGIVAVRDLPPGTYDLTVKAKRYEDFTRSYRLKGGTPLTAKVVMTKPERKKRSLVVLKRNRIVIRRKVHFATGTANLTRDSKALLAEVAQVLKDNPRISKVRIDGHTDGKGSRTKNLKLSKERAEAVKTYLARRGVRKKRLVTKGWGPDKPLAPNMTSRGREKNRRVEFIILGRR
ncbi:MAG: OmpA family protein [Bradymonadia bacterium]